MGILALILSVGLGFGLACLIFATLLAKSNDIGNSIGEVAYYSVGITYDLNRNKMKDSEKETFALGYFREEEKNKKVVPASDKLVEQSANVYNMRKGIDDSIRNLERR